MKLFMSILAAGLMTAACASPKEKYDDQRMEAKDEYNEEVKQAEEEYTGDEAELNKERAKDMVDDSDDAKVDIDEGKIKVED